MTAARAGHRRQAGNAAVVVAVGMVGLIAIVGLALDGGAEAGAYRHAQNAADAGALAAARQIFLNAEASNRTASNATTLTGVASAEVSRNKAQIDWVNSSSSSTTSTTTVTGMAPARAGTAKAMAPAHAQTMDAGGIGFSYVMADASLTATATVTNPLYPEAATSSQSAWIPATSNGLSAQAAVADIWATAGSALLPVNANLDLDQTTSTAQSIEPTSGGSVASSQVDVGQVTSSGVTGDMQCYTARATYSANADTYGAATACPLGTATTGVSATATVVGVGATNVKVDRFDAPTALPRVMTDNLSGIDGPVSVTAASAGSSNSLYWDLVNGVTARASVNASTLHAAMPTLTVDTSQLQSVVDVHMDPTSNQPVITMTCTPTTMTLTNLTNLSTSSVSVDSSCGATGLSISGLTSVTMPWVSPSLSTGQACTSNSSTGQESCTVQTCVLRAVVTANPYNSQLCLGQANVSFSVVQYTIPPSGYCDPATQTCCDVSTSACTNGTSLSSSSSTSTTSSGGTTTTTTTIGGNAGGSGCSDCAGYTADPLMSQFTGAVTVAATVPQSTYFMRVLGWGTTYPTATATAMIEPIVDESASAFSAWPVGMPDHAYSMDSPYTYERLRPGHDYYLWGPSMQADSPSTAMPTGWQGQLASTSDHRVGLKHYVTGTAVTTVTAPVTYQNSGYYLEPVFNPADGTVEYYGVFLPVSGQSHWGRLVNSIPSLGGHLVSATSETTWYVFEEGAMGVKLEQ